MEFILVPGKDQKGPFPGKSPEAFVVNGFDLRLKGVKVADWYSGDIAMKIM